MTPEITILRKSVALDTETEAIVEAYNQAMKFNNFSLALRQVIHQWHASQSTPPVPAVRPTPSNRPSTAILGG